MIYRRSQVPVHLTKVLHKWVDIIVIVMTSDCGTGVRVNETKA